MFQKSKGYNFRFTEGEMEILDIVRAEIQKSQSGFSSWRRLTRTDVIKMLIRREWATIQKRYEDEKCRSLESSKPTKKSKPPKATTNQARRTKGTKISKPPSNPA